MSLLPKTYTPRYRQLLIILVLNFLISPLLEAKIGGIVGSTLFFYTIILIIRRLAIPRFWYSVYLVIAAIAFCLDVTVSMGWAASFTVPFALFAQFIYALYLGIATWLIMRAIFMDPKVTLDTVEGGISAYFLIGNVWALFYGMVVTVDPNAFSQPLITQEYSHASFIRALHFSFTTLTTLGYGDIVPVSKVALVLSNLEAIIGQLYPAVFIAILVGGYLSQRNSH